jgi:UDP-N-acetylglucosamine transferase subunit ALG13
MPFDRLVKTIDKWAHDCGCGDVFAQIGPSLYRPSHIKWTQFLDPDDFRRRFEAAKVIVAHAGTGSIITALQFGKPIVVMPRRASLGETRNDHQVATVKQFGRLHSVTVAWDESALSAALDRIGELSGRRAIGPYASNELVRTIRRFIDGDPALADEQVYSELDALVGDEGHDTA